MLEMAVVSSKIDFLFVETESQLSNKIHKEGDQLLREGFQP